MIYQYNDDRTGWAQFSDDWEMRYRLTRSLTGRVDRRVVFLMLNPSTADAFVLDPTVNECRKRALALNADVLEVVNLFALRSPYPADLRRRSVGFRGDDSTNDAAILTACTGAHRVIAAWGNHGALDLRSERVLAMLADHRIPLHHLGMTQHGHPKHPLARGRHRIAADQQPIAW
jgi:hypothetical protein